MLSSSILIVVAAGFGTVAVCLAQTASPPDDSCAKALNSTPKTRQEFPQLVEFNRNWAQKLTSSNVRDHGWALYQGVVSPAGAGCSASTGPLWLSWATKSELFGPSSGSGNQGRQIRLLPSATLGMDQSIRNMISQFGNPASKAGKTGDLASNLGTGAAGLTTVSSLLANFPFQMPVTKERIFFTTAHYNPAAEQSALAKAPDLLLAAHKNVPSQITEPTPPTAIVVKPIWLPFEPGMVSACVPVWNPGAIPDDLGSYRPDLWPDQVRVSTATQIAPTGPCFPQHASVAQQVPMVSVNEFFSVLIDKEVDAEALSVVLPPNSPAVALAKTGNVALLVGFHVISKEVDSWSWNTYWWEPKQYRDGPLSAGRPKLGQPWDNYVMNSSLDEARVPLADSQGRCDVGAIYNPYQEAALLNQSTDPQPVMCGKPRTLGGLASNCRSCHSLAGYQPPDRAPIVTIQPSTDWLQDYFKDKTRTGFLWSIPNYAFR